MSVDCITAVSSAPPLHRSTAPPLHRSTAPPFHRSTVPPLPYLRTVLPVVSVRQACSTPSFKTSATPSPDCLRRPALLLPSPSRSVSASAPTPPCSASSTGCSSGPHR